MSKQVPYLVIGIGIVSILFGVYGIIRGGEQIDALSGILLGVVIIGTVIFERNKKAKGK